MLLPNTKEFGLEKFNIRIGRCNDHTLFVYNEPEAEPYGQ